MNSIATVATELDLDFTRLRQGEVSLDRFLEKYGHLRPGTYDITKLPYRKETSYITSNGTKPNPSLHREEPSPSHPQEDSHPWDAITEVCRKHQIDADGRRLAAFIKKAIELREYFKFVYSKNISEALELIASIGEELGFTREELAHLDYYSIVNNRESCNRQEVADIWRHLIESRQKESRISALLSLPALVFAADDFQVVPSFSSKPNFITDLRAEGEVVALDKANAQASLHDKIVAIEKADPGYDWIFTKAIRGLLTKYGGAGSHMAIRCAEFGIPAAIGCGEMTFGKVLRATRVTLDCKGKKIHTDS
jgi:phosphohistidine swiveling domain-containing protein